MASIGPHSLILLLVVWLAFILAGFTGIFWALGHTLFDGFQLSVSSIVTLGFAAPRDVWSSDRGAVRRRPSPIRAMLGL